MRSVKIFYNPYLEKTRLFIDDKERQKRETRLDEFIVGQNMESWLYPYVKSYRKWNGILYELMDTLNDDDLQITFFSSPKYFSVMEMALEKQISVVEEKGYASDKWKLVCEEYYALPKIIKRMKELLFSNKIFLPDAYCIVLAEDVEDMLNKKTQFTEDEIKEIYKQFKELVKISYQISGKKKQKFAQRWKNVNKELVRLWESKNG